MGIQRASKRTLVLVGDEGAFLHHLSDIMESAGYPVRVALTASRALVESARPDVGGVVLELGASKLQSVEVALGLRKRPGAPVMIALSSMPNVGQHCMVLGIHHHLSQPFRVVELFGLLDRVVPPWPGTASVVHASTRQLLSNILRPITRSSALPRPRPETR
jgi:CheY-like chemotaxis protein